MRRLLPWTPLRKGSHVTVLLTATLANAQAPIERLCTTFAARIRTLSDGDAKNCKTTGTTPPATSEFSQDSALQDTSFHMRVPFSIKQAVRSHHHRLIS
jgi:hypothetical protein